jgi:hypothetical protein
VYIAECQDRQWNNIARRTTVRVESRMEKIYGTFNSVELAASSESSVVGNYGLT